MSTARRLGVAFVALAFVGTAVASLLLLLISPLAIAIRKDDWSLRLPFLAIAALIGSGVALAWLLGATGPAERTRIRRRRTAVAVLVAVTCVAWAAIGIDSTRAVRDLPEASLAFPGAIETNRFLEPSTVGFGHHGATLTRTYDSAHPYRDVLAFYAGELRARGWSGGERCGDRDMYGSTVCTFYRADFTIRIELRTPNLAERGSFTMRVTGPP